jgi:ABC-type phosphate/phosphonate transport system substrate-binding protein
MIASARMYEWTPSLVTAWRSLLEWVAARARVELELASGGLSLDELWGREDLGCVFMCGYPYALRPRLRRPALLAAPVPSLPRFGDEPVYVSDFIVRADGPHRRFEDTFGGCIAYSTEHSQSGYNAARHHLLAYRSPGRPALFTEVKGPYVRQRAVVQAVLDGAADVAAIDGYAHDLLKRHDPALAQCLRVVATTTPSPSPPLVASPAMALAERGRLAAALLEADTAPEMKPVMEDLLLRRFARVSDRDFDVMLEQQRAADAAGYPKIA